MNDLQAHWENYRPTSIRAEFFRAPVLRHPRGFKDSSSGSNMVTCASVAQVCVEAKPVSVCSFARTPVHLPNRHADPGGTAVRCMAVLTSCAPYMHHMT
jgi:hypothetical protein